MLFFRTPRRALLSAAALTLVVCLAALIYHTTKTSQAAGFQGPGAELWQDVPNTELNALVGERWVNPLSFRALRLNREAMAQLLAQAPLERTPAAQQNQVVLTIPLPDGRAGRFRVVEAPIMAAELARQFPEIKTYYGQGLDDRAATVRFDLTPTGFHALILSAGDSVYVDPVYKGNPNYYASYFKRDFRKPGWARECLTQSLPGVAPDFSAASPSVSGGQTLRTYRLALAATGEYTAYHGGTVVSALAAMVTSMNRINGIYEREVAVRLILVPNNTSIIYTNPNSDPYTNDNGFALLNQNQTNLDAVIGSANYDIGHVFSTGGGGIANLRSVCSPLTKARGVTGSSHPVGDPFDVDYVAHEMGHQFGGNHSFNGTTSSCSGNRASAAAYEPGSGSTIMAYAGICGAENLQPHSDDYFHNKNLEEITAFINGAGGACAVPLATGNTPPTVKGNGSYFIPRQTPFALTALGSDANGDGLTYCWEQYDLGAASPPNTDDGTRPILRSYNSTTSSTRVFPRLTDLLNNTTSIGESLPTTTRTLNFKVTARDNRVGGGGIVDNATQVFVRAEAGPFLVTNPNTAVSWTGGSTQTVTWNVASTNNAPISCASVKIALSLDGGLTFPSVLAVVPNTGSALVNVPNTPSNQARIKIEAVDNVFFDLSNVNFTITSGSSGGGVRAKKADFDGDGKTDLSVWRGPETNWFVINSSHGGLSTVPWGASYAPYHDVIVPGDYDGDGKTDQAIWRGSNSVWYIRKSSDGSALFDLWGANYAPFFDIPTPGDYDGDGKTDLAVWRPANGTFYIKRSLDGSAWFQQLGQQGDTPVPADYDGDGKTDFAVWRGVDTNWYILNSSGGSQTISWGAGYAPYFDTPVPADYDGDGKTDAAIWRGGNSIWYIRPSSNPGNPILRLWGASYALYFDVPVPGDYDGDGKADIAVWRPTDGRWYVIRSLDGAFLIQAHGQSGDTPVPSAGVR